MTSRIDEEERQRKIDDELSKKKDDERARLLRELYGPPRTTYTDQRRKQRKKERDVRTFNEAGRIVLRIVIFAIITAIVFGAAEYGVYSSNLQTLQSCRDLPTICYSQFNNSVLLESIGISVIAAFTGLVFLIKVFQWILYAALQIHDEEVPVSSRS